MQHSVLAHELSWIIDAVLRLYFTALDYPENQVYDRRHSYYEDDEDVLIALIERSHNVWRSRRKRGLETTYVDAPGEVLTWKLPDP